MTLCLDCDRPLTPDDGHWLCKTCRHPACRQCGSPAEGAELCPQCAYKSGTTELADVASVCDSLPREVNR